MREERELEGWRDGGKGGRKGREEQERGLGKDGAGSEDGGCSNTSSGPVGGSNGFTQSSEGQSGIRGQGSTEALLVQIPFVLVKAIFFQEKKE